METGDFARFAKGNVYAAYLGLAPGEHSSSDDINRLGITKAGNSHLRLLLTEAAGGICKGAVGHKSKDLRARQNGNSADVIAYADKANTRLRSKYYRMIRHGKKRNVAVADIVIENRQLRQEVKRLREIEKEYHDYIMEEYKAGQRAFKDIICIPLENICRINAAHNN